MADAVLGLCGRATRSEELGAQIETHIIMMFLARNQLGRNFADVDSPLLDRYREEAKNSGDTWYADQILERAEWHWKNIMSPEFPGRSTNWLQR